MRLTTLIHSWLAYIDVYIGRRSSIEARLSERPENHEYAECSLHRQADPLRIHAEELRSQLLGNQVDIIRHQIACKWQVIDHAELSGTGSKLSMRTCPVCGHRNEHNLFKILESHCLFGGGRLVRYQCPYCEVIFGPDKMLELTSQQLGEEYEWHYKVYSEGDSTEQELKAFHCLKPSKTGLYLNYGAGSWSHSVEVLRREGWNVLAYEPHGSASQSESHVITSKDELSKMKFDGIFSNNVIEHLRHPIQELSAMLQLLKDNGRMAHATPCFEYLYEYTRFHLYFFLGKSFSIVAEQSGLEVEDFVNQGEFMCSILRRK